MPNGGEAQASPGEAVQAALASLGPLAAANLAGRPTAELAQCLRDLERAESMLTAARANTLRAFTAQAGPAEDGHGSPRAWLAWQTRVTSGAAAGAVGWARRLAAHPGIAAGLAAGWLSGSWARQMCDWSDKLPADRRGDADQILTAAAEGGADLDGLAMLAEEIYRRTAPPDRGPEDSEDRRLVLDRTFGGAGRLGGDLTPRCTAALSAVLDSLSGKAGPEDTRTRPQREHDALEEACRRLLGSGCLPDRAGQPAQIRLHMNLADLLGQPGAATTAWAAGQSGVVPGDDCDAQLVPQVDGRLDRAALEQLAQAWITQHGLDTAAATNGTAGASHPGRADRSPGRADQGGSPLPRATTGRLVGSLLALAVNTLSGPDGLAAWLRTRQLPGPAASPSLPLDIGQATDIIPAYLRRAVLSRHPHCVFPGCRQPGTWCQIHHLQPRADGGATALQNLIPLCAFHHLIAVHQWGWRLTLHADGTVSARGPDGRVLHDTGSSQRRLTAY